MKSPIPQSKFKTGMKVRFWTKKEMPSQVKFSWAGCGGMDYLHGKPCVITLIKPDGEVELSGVDTKRWNISTDMITPANKREAARLAAAMAAEKKAEEKRIKELAISARASIKRMSRASIDVADYLNENRDAFGCQRAHVVAIVSALTGENIAGVLEAAKIAGVKIRD